jgi:hypothetical protein
MTVTAIMGGLFLALGIGLLTGVAWLFMLARASSSWPPAPGRVVSSKVEVSYGTRQSTRTSYRLALRYEYEVDGRTLTGQRVAFGDTFWASTRSRDDAERMQRVYPEGKEVTVFHDPVHVGRCTLDRSFNGRRYYQLFAVAVGLVVAGIAIFTGHIHVQN